MNSLPEDLQYSIYYAIDDDDKIYNKIQNKKKLLNTQYYKQFTNKSFKINMKPFILSTKNIPKGNVVAMWNMLFKKAYDDGNDYFFQSGDDIVFYQKNWLNPCLKQIIANNNIGTSAPNDINNMRILTQSVVSRKHMEIFGYYFNPQITNWGCDDWINGIYNQQFLKRNNTTLMNKGGKPRYNVVNDRKLWDDLINQDKKKLVKYLNMKCIA